MASRTTRRSAGYGLVQTALLYRLLSSSSAPGRVVHCAQHSGAERGRTPHALAADRTDTSASTSSVGSPASFATPKRHRSDVVPRVGRRRRHTVEARRLVRGHLRRRLTAAGEPPTAHSCGSQGENTGDLRCDLRKVGPCRLASKAQVMQPAWR